MAYTYTVREFGWTFFAAQVIFLGGSVARLEKRNTFHVFYSSSHNHGSVENGAKRKISCWDLQMGTFHLP